MVERGFEPQVKGVQLQQKIAMVDSKIEQAEVSLPGIDLEKKRIDQQIKITKQKFISGLRKREAARADLANATMKQDQLSDRVARTEIKSPTDGIISKVEVNTIGEVVSPAMQLVEIIPLSDELVIETELEVQDIISISVGQNARVSFSAYDPGIYGYLNASVEKIGIDTQQREGSYYYPVRVKTKVENLTEGIRKLNLSPA